MTGEKDSNMNLVRTIRIWYKKHFPLIARRIIRWIITIFLAIVGDFALLYLLSILTTLNLIDWKTVVSFLAVEVLAAVVARLIGIGQESDDEIRYRKLRLASFRERLVPRYGHLEIVCLRGEEDEYPEYPHSQYYVINVCYVTAYWVNRDLCELMQEGVIRRRVFREAVELTDYLAKNKITVEKRYPEGDELQMPPPPEITPV
jgi:hypothetical protein